MAETKRCSKCGTEKPLERFTRRPEGSGYVSRCKSCKAADEKGRRDRDPEKYRARQRFYRNNGGAARERAAKQRRKTADFFGYHTQFARRFNKEITSDDLRTLWDAQGGLCGLTGRVMVAEAGKVSLDHIVPRAKGGSHELTNLRWVCSEANLLKRDLSDDELLALCSDVAEWIGRRLLGVVS